MGRGSRGNRFSPRGGGDAAMMPNLIIGSGDSGKRLISFIIINSPCWSLCKS
jgi:hypothetical protein